MANRLLKLLKGRQTSTCNISSPPHDKRLQARSLLAVLAYYHPDLRPCESPSRNSEPIRRGRAVHQPSHCLLLPDSIAVHLSPRESPSLSFLPLTPSPVLAPRHHAQSLGRPLQIFAPDRSTCNHQNTSHVGLRIMLKRRPPVGRILATTSHLTIQVLVIYCAGYRPPQRHAFDVGTRNLSASFSLIQFWGTAVKGALT